MHDKTTFSIGKVYYELIFETKQSCPQLNKIFNLYQCYYQLLINHQIKRLPKQTFQLQQISNQFLFSLVE